MFNKSTYKRNYNGSSNILFINHLVYIKKVIFQVHNNLQCPCARIFSQVINFKFERQILE